MLYVECKSKSNKNVCAKWEENCSAGEKKVAMGIGLIIVKIQGIIKEMNLW